MGFVSTGWTKVRVGFMSRPRAAAGRGIDTGAAFSAGRRIDLLTTLKLALQRSKVELLQLAGLAVFLEQQQHA